MIGRHHEPAYPNNRPPFGFTGDFEFIIRDKTPDTFELIGRKKRVHAVLVKATEQDWVR
jgi:hypothetical protein